ncbi:acetoacetate decarboxylase [Sesbania bispinosa]|nr:acetoacetate decarboxylase [Sesbania bispinosa]
METPRTVQRRSRSPRQPRWSPGTAVHDWDAAEVWDGDWRGRWKRMTEVVAGKAAMVVYDRGEDVGGGAARSLAVRRNYRVGIWQ